MNLRITLTPDEEKFANDIAVKRNKSQRSANRKDGKVLSDSLGIDKLGARAELAVAKALGEIWDGKFFEIEQWYQWRESGNDVNGLEIRATSHRNGRLIIHPKDKDYAPFILVLAHRAPLYEIVGWCYGFEGKRQEWWQDVGYGRPCYYVPRDILREMNTLSIKVESKKRVI